MATPEMAFEILSRNGSTIASNDSLPQRPHYEVNLGTLEYVDPYDHNLMCAICHSPFVLPVKLDCEHVFCQRCINQAIKHQHQNSRSCPSCRRRIGSSPVTRVLKILDRILDELLVKCPFQVLGCIEEMPRCRVQDHLLRYCNYSEVDCPNESCGLPLQRKDMKGTKCLHYLVHCEDCGLEMMERDLESHRTLKCEFRKANCPDCREQVLIQNLETHIERCPEAIFPCTAAGYGCEFIARQTNLEEHLKQCALAKLVPFLKLQNDRLEAHESAIKHLRHRNSILETSFSTMNDSLGPSANFIDAPENLVSPSDPGPFDSTAHHLLSLHESLREEVSRVSAAVSELDAKAGVMVMNESLRRKEDFIHTNATIGGMRAQLHWLVSARLQNQQRVATLRMQTSDAESGVGASSTTAGPSGAMTLPIRRLSDSNRQDPKL